MKIHQFVHTLNYGDAISTEALVIQRILRGLFGDSKIYVLHCHQALKDFATDWQTFQTDINKEISSGDDTAIILHYSIGCPLNQLFVSQPNIKRILIYHNLTPTKWFTQCNFKVASDLSQGQEELPKILQQCDLVLADSEYNRKELETFGYPKARVLPLLLDNQKWKIAANEGIVKNLKSVLDVNILHVGRLAPNKCIEDIIKSFYFYHHKINKKSRLWIIGSSVDTEIYYFTLRRMVLGLHLKHAVFFVGTVADCELRAFYENCDLYVCMSEHEGFCLPLLEAMHFNLPVLAYNSSAVGETLGNAGALLAYKSPAETAEIMDIMIRDEEVRAEFIQRGRQRLTLYSESVFKNNFKNLVLSCLE